MSGCPIIRGGGDLPPLPPPPELPDLPDLPPPGYLDPLPPYTVPSGTVSPSIPPADPAAAVDPVSVDPVPYIEGDAPGVVASVLGTTGVLAATSQANALASIEQLAGYAAAFTPIVSPVIPTAAVEVPALGEAPAAPDLSSNFATLPDAPADISAPALDLGAPPVYDVQPATVSDIDLPDPLTAVEPTAPDLLEVDGPSEPVFALPAVPTLIELEISDAPVITIPVFDALLVARPNAPTVAFAYDEIEYESALLTAMNARLATLVMDDEDTGVLATVEQGLFDRAASRESLLTNRAAGEAQRLLKSRGFRIPEATMARVVQQALQDGLKRSASFNRDIAVARAQLWQQNFRFSVESAIALESRMIEKHNAAMARSLEAAKVMVSVEIDFFNANVQMYSADIQAFVVKAQVFRARLEAALATIEVYKARLEAEKVRGEINSQRVAIYKAQIAGVTAIVDTYKTRVEAAKEMIIAGRSRIEAYRAQVQAFAAQIEAKDGEYQTYAASMKAGSQKARLFAGQVEAYTSRVKAFDTLVKAKVGAQELIFKQANEFPLELYKAKIDAYRTGSQAVADKMKSTVQVFSSRIRAYVAQEGAKNDRVDAQIAVARANAESAISSAETMIRAGEANLRIADGVAQTAQNNVRSAGQLAGQLAAAAIAAQSVHASITENGGVTYSNHASDSATNGTTTSSQNSTGRAVANNSTSTAESGISERTQVADAHRRSYNRDLSNTTSTRRSNSYSVDESVNYSETLANSTDTNATASIDCIDRTTYTD